MFASVDLAARIERSETRLLAASCEEVARRRGSAHDGFCIPLAGGVASYTGRGSPLNKIAGLGFGGPITDVDLDAIEKRYVAHGCPVQVEVSTLADPAIAQQLTRRGYTLMNFENVNGIVPGAAPPQLVRCADPADITIAPCAAEHFAEWLNVVVTGFETPDGVGVESHEAFSRSDLERVFTDMAAAPGFVHYIARRERLSVGGASMFVGEGVAHLCGAATLPAHRRRGVQTALLNYRLQDAHARGCDLAMVTTQPGSKSQQNVQRRGFSLLYARAVLVLDNAHA